MTGTIDVLSNDPGCEQGKGCVPLAEMTGLGLTRS